MDQKKILLKLLNIACLAQEISYKIERVKEEDKESFSEGIDIIEEAMSIAIKQFGLNITN